MASVRRASAVVCSVDPIITLVNSAIPDGLPLEIREEVWSSLALAVIENRGVLPPASAIKKLVSRIRGDSYLNAFKRTSFDDPISEENHTRKIDTLSGRDVEDLKLQGRPRKRRYTKAAAPCRHCGSEQTKACGYSWYSGLPQSVCKSCNRTFVDRLCNRKPRPVKGRVQTDLLREPPPRPNNVVTSPCPRCQSENTEPVGYESYSGKPKSHCVECGRYFNDIGGSRATRPDKARRPDGVRPYRTTNGTPCPKCGSRRTHAAGYRRTGAARSLCRTCWKYFTDSTRPRHPSQYNTERGIWERVRRKYPCDARWAQFATFKADMGPRPADHTLRRLDASVPYGPTNCQWTPKQEARRRGMCGPTPRQVTAIQRCVVRLLASLRRAHLDEKADEVTPVLEALLSSAA